MTTPLAHEPKPKEKIYKFNEWRNKPKNPDKLKGTPQPYFFTDGDRLETIAPKYGLTWQQLTRYNWNTDDEFEVNWYLHEYCGCNGLTSTGNYYFTPTPTPVKIVRFLKGEFVWVPDPNPPQPSPKPTPRRQQCTFDTPICLVKKDGECNLKVCINPILKWMNSDPVELGSKGEVLLHVKEIQEAQHVYVHLVQHLVYRLKRHFRAIPPDRRWPVLIDPDSYEQQSHELVSLLMIEFPPAKTVMSRPKSRDHIEPDSPRARSIVESALSQTPIWTGNEPIVKPEEIDEAANVLRILQDAGILARVVVRGHAEQLETADPIEGHALGKRRAQWVVHHLINRCRLRLVQEPQAGAKLWQKDIDLYNQRVASGFIPVCAVGCGEYFAPKNCKPAPEWRRVTIEVEVKSSTGDEPPDKNRKKTDKALTQHCWFVYQSLRNGSLDKTLLYGYGNEHNGLARGPQTAELFRSEALAYMRLCGEIARMTGEDFSKARQGTLDSWSHIINWILGWEYSAVFGPTKLTDAYTYFKDKNQLRHRYDEFIAAIGQNGVPPWIEVVPVTAHPGWIDHRREVLRAHCELAFSEGSYKELKRRVGLELEPWPLWAHFKEGEPKP